MMQQMPDSFRDQRAEFLPVEWRSKLTLDGGMLHYALQPLLRILLHHIILLIFINLVCLRYILHTLADFCVAQPVSQHEGNYV